MGSRPDVKASNPTELLSYWAIEPLSPSIHTVLKTNGEKHWAIELLNHWAIELLNHWVKTFAWEHRVKKKRSMQKTENSEVSQKTFTLDYGKTNHGNFWFLGV